jgi:hypothetical protein
MPQTIFYARDGHINLFFLGTRPRPVFEQAFHDLLTKSAAQNEGIALPKLAGRS